MKVCGTSIVFGAFSEKEGKTQFLKISNSLNTLFEQTDMNV